MRVLMLAQSPVAGDARILREARALRDAGYDVTVVGRGAPASGDPEGVTVLDAGRPAGLGSGSGGLAPVPFQVARSCARWLLLPEHREKVEADWRASAARLVRDLPVDVVHAHDRNTLELGASEADRRGVPLVYDAHELWSDRPLPGRPTPLRNRRATDRETRWASRAAVVLTVSEGIAQVLRARGLQHVRVVRNSFPPLPAGPVVAQQPRGLVYAGRIAPGRDLETLVAAATRPGGLPTLLLGPEDAHYAGRLRLPPTAERVPPLPIDEVDRVLAEYGVAAITAAGRSRNHLLGLPNKLFQAVRAGVPVVAADLPEQGRAIRTHGIGELYRPGDVDSLAAAVQRVRARFPELTEAVRIARPHFTWDTDAAVLLGAYERLRR